MFQSQTKLITVEAFLSFIQQPKNEDRHFELIDGEIVEKMPTQLHALIANLLNAVFIAIFNAIHKAK